MDYKEFAGQRRIDMLKMTHRAQSSHIGSNFSCIDILSVLYNIADLSLLPDGRTKDVIIIKAWAAASVYACLVAKELLPQEAVDDYGKEETKWGTVLDGLPPYIPFETGAMGYHLPAAVGFALAKKIKGEGGIVYCLISDGELNIGSTWESLAIAKQHKLDNLIIVVDQNSLQAMGATKDILDMEPLDEKLKAFGWSVTKIDGHNFEQIENAVNGKDKKEFRRLSQAPEAIIAKTIKGKGWKRAENNNLFHYSHVNEEMLKEALAELENGN